jgi:hypothetical protein
MSKISNLKGGKCIPDRMLNYISSFNLGDSCELMYQVTGSKSLEDISFKQACELFDIMIKEDSKLYMLELKSPKAMKTLEELTPGGSERTR